MQRCKKGAERRPFPLPPIHRQAGVSQRTPTLPRLASNQTLARINRPIWRHPSGTNATMDEAARPIGGVRYISMLDRVDVHVIPAPLKIVFVADQVFPVATLPDTSLAFLPSRGGYTFADRNATWETGLDHPLQCIAKPSVAVVPQRGSDWISSRQPSCSHKRAMRSRPMPSPCIASPRAMRP